MKIRSFLIVLALCFIAASVCFAADPSMGTWKLNETKSKLSPAMGKTITVVYEPVEGDNVKITVDGLDTEGKPTHSEWTGKFDEKDYPVTGDPNADARSYKRIDENALHAINKKGGKVTSEVHIVLSADGKSRTVTFEATDSKGNKATSVAVYDKQ